jgi:hypothetical protein
MNFTDALRETVKLVETGKITTFGKSFDSTWVTLKQGDPSFHLIGSLYVASRAGIQINADCPKQVRDYVMLALKSRWIEPIATVPKNDPTLMWDTLQS